MIDLNEAAAFLKALRGQSFVFQTFTDNKALVPNGTKDRLAKHFIGSFDEHKFELLERNNQGAGIFVQLNEGDGRSKADITNIRAVFIDLDYPKTLKQSLEAIKQWLPKPTIITKTSAGKLHMYWAVDGLSIDNFDKVQTALATKFGGDLAMKNLDRVVRLPGFDHCKGKPQRVSATILGGCYAAKDIVKAIEAAQCQVEADRPVKLKPKPASTDCFGLDIGDGYEKPAEVGKGGRVNELVRYIGKLVSEGWTGDTVKEKLLEFNNKHCNPPVDMARLEREVLPSIANFTAGRDIPDQSPVMTPVKVLQPPDVPAAPAPDVPAAPPATEVVESDVNIPPCTVPTANMLGHTNEAANSEVFSLEAWNSRFVHISAGNRVGDRASGGAAAISTDAEFKRNMQGVNLDGKFIYHSWVTSRERISVRDERYRPDNVEFIRDSEDNYMYWNSYRPSHIVPAIKCDPEKIEPFVELIKFFCPKHSDFDLLMNWLTVTYSKPAYRISWAPVFVSQPGAGKGMLYTIMRKLMGTCNSRLVSADRLDNQFNSFLYQSTLVAIDEMTPSSRSAYNKLKTYVTEEFAEINMKNAPEVSKEIFPSILIFTNDTDAIPIEDGDRRFWVHSIEGRKHQTFYDKLADWMDDEANISHLMAYFNEREVHGNWHKQHPPMTIAKQNMLENNRSELEKSFYDSYKGREGAFAADVTCFKSVKEFMQIKIGHDVNASQEKTLSKLLNKVSLPIEAWSGRTLPINVGTGTSRQRPKCLRNVEAWAKQDSDVITHELNRSQQLAAGRGDVEPPMLKLVDEG
jgi:hypothetical protein